MKWTAVACVLVAGCANSSEVEAQQFCTSRMGLTPGTSKYQGCYRSYVGADAVAAERARGFALQAQSDRTVEPGPAPPAQAYQSPAWLELVRIGVEGLRAPARPVAPSMMTNCTQTYGNTTCITTGY